MRVILFSPDIPQNVGNIARTCTVTNTQLTLVRPFHFNLSDKQIKRSGLDYLNAIEIKIADSIETALCKPFYFFSTKGTQCYTEISYTDSTSLIFGSESAGLPQWVHEKWPALFYTIPMRNGVRSLNLSNAVAIVLYEALRQQNFKSLL